MTRKLSVRAKVSSLALAAALVAGPSTAAAQSLQGAPTITFGNANISEGATTTTVTLNTNQTVIDWAPNDNAVGNFGAINFQPAGTTATFQNNVDLVGDFAVLNRVNVTDQNRIVALNGTINSLVNGQTGGSVFFYSPSGFVLTGTSIINVGSLVLTASPITVTDLGNGQGSFINNGVVEFGQAPNPNAAINTVSDINGTSQINSSGSGNYVALVAPTILHQGDIRTDGSVALVAAEAATIKFNPFGLFDIQVTVGTDASQGIHVDGGTIGRNSEAVSSENIHRAYLVAVAKNDAVTMLVNNGASIGFEIGTSATVEDNAVIISGGYNVEGGNQTTYSGVSEVPLTITNASLSSNVDAKVTGGAAINSSQGALTFGGDLSIIGGARTTTGGNVLIDGSNGNALTIAGDLTARGFRDNADGSNTGLITRLGAQSGSTVTIGGDVILDSSSFGTQIGEFNETGTNATGGNAQVNIGANSILNVAGSVTVRADGYGGSSAGGGTSGFGMGGQALVMSINGNATVTVGGSVFASAQGFGGGVGSDCQAGCGVTGGNGIGGNASVHTNVGSGNLMQIAGDVTVSAYGEGGAGDVQAGRGFGGTANVGASDSSSLTIGADTNVDASGLGGDGFDTADGGLGRGGTARVGTNTNGSIDLTGPAFVSANGQGGAGANGGTGTGGLAQIVAFQGTIHAFDNASVTALSLGGFVNTDGGAGGSGLADIENTSTPEMTEASLIANGGTLTIDGLSLASVNATGGDGGFNGGDGGISLAGGTAGIIQGGAVIHAINSDFAPSVIRLGDAVVTSDAQGGQGGNGQGGVNGSDGGNGGSATGGKAVVTAAAGNGDLIADAVIVSASAIGGQGGDGGNGDGGSSGNGGDGGDAFGGFINVGTESGNANFAQAINDGQATFTSIIAIADATGGDGGGFSFGTPSGTPGDGGDAFGGNSVLLVRGSLLTVGNVFLDASAVGGDGGMDSNDAPQGLGGDAVTGGVGVIVTNRFQHIDHRGTLDAGSITGMAVATGGAGSVAGSAWTQGASSFQVINSDATIGSVSLAVGASDGLHPTLELFNSPIAVVNGTVNVSGAFYFQTPGSVSVYADDPTPLTASLTAGSIDIAAGNFIHEDDPSRPGPASVGAFSADSINLITPEDLVLDANLVSTGSLDLFAPGLIDIRDATSGGDLTLQAGETISGGTQAAAGFISAFAPGNITLGNMNAGSSIFVESTDGDISLASLSADDTIDLDAAGDISFADVLADFFNFDAGGTVTGGDIVAGTEASGQANGAVTLGNINVGITQTGGAAEQGFAVGITSAASISVGDVDADEAIGFATLGNLTAGDLNAGTNVMTLVGGDTSIASITTPGTGRTYHGDAQMFLDAGGPDDFDPSLVLGAVPLRSGGSYTVTGPISTGRIQVGAASISSGAITAPISVELDAASTIATGNIAGGDHILLNAGSGSITIGNATATNAFQAAAGTNLTAGAVSAGNIAANAGGTATIGGAWSAGDVQVTSNDIDITATGSISAGDIALISTNATQTVVGDGVAGGGYQLVDAEYDRLHSNDISVIADTGLGAAGLMLIGDLTVDGSDGEAIHDYEFITGDSESETAEGSIRILGDMVFSNMGTNQSVGFTAGTFELDAATGLLSLASAPGTLGGQLFLNAAHIHVASGDILDRLGDDPQYDGYQDDLNAPAAVQRPDGVIRAGSIEIDFGDAGAGELNTLFVQNTGTSDLPAGFLVSQAVLLGEGNETTPPPGSIDLIINGQIVTEAGTLTGVEVRDALVESEGDLTPFTANSTINGCLLVGACGVIEPPEPPFPPGFTPTPGIQDEITLIGDNLLPRPPFGNEDFIDDNDEESDEGQTSPIVPPDPLFDTSQLGDAAGGESPDVGTAMRSTPGLTNSGDVDDPVSGSGNPGLMETPPPPPSNEEKQP